MPSGILIPEGFFILVSWETAQSYRIDLELISCRSSGINVYFSIDS